MNTKRIVAGGAVAAVIMNVLDFITNVPVFGGAWTDAHKALGLTPSQALVGGYWTCADIVCGLTIVWLYAAMRPRFGAGPKTAALASLTVWGLLHMGFWGNVVDGTLPLWLVAATSACELVSTLAGGFAGCRLYAEPSDAGRK
jgi:hypothetical protein